MPVFPLLFSFIKLKKLLKLFRNKKFFKNNPPPMLKRGNLNKWMNLTKKERYNLSKKESASYLSKRKVLLDEIREEYKRISKNNSKKNS